MAFITPEEKTAWNFTKKVSIGVYEGLKKIIPAFGKVITDKGTEINKSKGYGAPELNGGTNIKTYGVNGGGGPVKDGTPSPDSPAGSTTILISNVPDVNFFQLYGLREFSPYNSNPVTKDNNDKEVQADDDSNWGSFLPITIKKAKTFEEYEDDKLSDFTIVLPWKVGELSDTVSVSYGRKFGGQTTLTQEIIKAGANVVGNLANTLGITDGETTKSVKDKLATWLLASYDAQSLNKTLQLEFILPLTNVPVGKETDFINSLRMALGTLQGLLYPRSLGFAYPPMVRVSFGGIYQGFKGFVENVRLTYSEEMIPVGNYMIPMIITGSISFKNIYMYTWDNTQMFGGGAGEFSLSAHPQLLFGIGEGETSYSGNTANITFQNEIATNEHYIAGTNDRHVAEYQNTLMANREKEHYNGINYGIKNKPNTDMTVVDKYNPYYSMNASPDDIKAYSNWYKGVTTNAQSIFTYGLPMTLSDVVGTIANTTITNALADVYVGNFNVGTFLGRYTDKLIKNITDINSFNGTLAEIATNSVRDIAGNYYVGGVSIGNILGSVGNR